MNTDKLNDDFSLEEMLRKTRNRMKDGTRKNRPSEKIDKLKNKVEEIIESILLLNSERHFGKGKDVDYLTNLEKEYLMKGYMSNYRLAQNIIINEKYIIVSGMEIRRFDEQDELNKEAGIFKSTDGDKTLYKLKTAKRKAASMKYDILSTSQLKQLISSMPGDTVEEKIINFSNIFNLEFSGFYEYYGSFIRDVGLISYYWIMSSTRDRMYSVGIKKDEISNTKRASMYNAMSLRCVRKIEE